MGARESEGGGMNLTYSPCPETIDVPVLHDAYTCDCADCRQSLAEDDAVAKWEARCGN
jgi:hypothetical protein